MAQEIDIKAEKKKLAEEKKKLRAEQKAQSKEAKKRAKELADKEADLDDDAPGGGLSMILVTVFIVLIWIGIICILIKLDVGGLGSNVLRPIIGNVPVINKVLPSDGVTETDDLEAYYGYSSLADAVAQIQALELELTSAQTANGTYVQQIEELKAEVNRLKTFEDQQTEFQRIKTEFYEEVVYADNGSGADAYKKYYEQMDPETAQYLYQEVVKKAAVDAEITDYAAAYAAMEPKDAAEIFNTMGSSLDLVGKILGAMNSAQRGAILGAMDPEMAAQVTRIMDPD
ncbi:MAG: hypothetical protein IKO53_04120, partial [Lachnospiraceae bacterium]|nr:hypothetical protein [Lachnospiraceae bacterium]